MSVMHAIQGRSCSRKRLVAANTSTPVNDAALRAAPVGWTNPWWSPPPARALNVIRS